MSSEPIDTAIREIKQGMKAIENVSIEDLNADELANFHDECGRLASEARLCSLRLIGALHRRSAPVALGGKPLSSVLSERWRISEPEARRRIDEAVALGYG
jgi:hypothetical protein